MFLNAQLKMKFYQCFNAIYHKACNADNELVCVQLMKSVSLPVLLYSLEVLFPSKTAINMLNNVADRAFYRIFKCTDNSDIKFIRSMFDLLDVNVIRLQRHTLFLRHFTSCSLWSDIICHYNEG